MLERFFKVNAVRHRPYLAFLFGLFFTLIAFAISRVLFSSFLSLATVFMASLFLIPTLIYLIKMEEQIEGRYGLKHFFHNHKDIFEAYLFGFLGAFFAFFILGLATYGTSMHGSLFSFQKDFIQFQQGLNTDNLQQSIDQAEPSWWGFTDLLAHNLIVVIICFVLSFFYSASAIFLIILNGSVFAHFIVFIIKELSANFVQGMQATGAFMLHLLPETAAFLIAAMAGGIVSKAVMDEKRGSERFRNVFKDATVLVIMACILVLIGALVETFVTTRLFGLLF